MARRLTTRIGGFARIDSHTKSYFHSVRAIRVNRLEPTIRDFWCPEMRFAKKGVQLKNPQTIPENRANLRIDSRESGHLSATGFSSFVKESQQILNSTLLNPMPRAKTEILVFCKTGWCKTGLSEQGYGSYIVHA